MPRDSKPNIHAVVTKLVSLLFLLYNAAFLLPALLFYCVLLRVLLRALLRVLLCDLLRENPTALPTTFFLLHQAACPTA